MSSRSMFRTWLRRLCAFVALVFGLLALASGVLGPEPIQISSTDHVYYQIVLNPSPYWFLWAALGLTVAVALIALPLFARGSTR